MRFAEGLKEIIMEEKKELICIGCPMGCPLSATMEGAEVVAVTGQTCKRGEVYAKKELTNPTRIVTSTVRLADGGMVPVKTASDIPKHRIFACVQQLKDITVAAPVHIGQVIVENIAETGVCVVATREICGRMSEGKSRRRSL